MSHTSEARAKLQELLRDLFQFDSEDLDFGIYRIMNHKRAEIERFIERDLLDAVVAELDQGALSSQAQAASQLAEAAQEVRSALGAEAISPEGDLSEDYRATPVGQRYLELREEAATYRARPEQETVVFNHLFEFFRRYYQDGDFISKRRYSKRERYAIPYNGEEVHLHWANKDQYYVKTGEHFTSYSFRAPGDVTVHFRLQSADVEQNNVKGEKRFFVPVPAEVKWDGDARELMIPFEYRPLTKGESVACGTRDQQAKIIADALEKVPARLRKQAEVRTALMAERRRSTDGEPVSYLEHHLRRYAARNTRDFFIHRNLRGFLERELDCYLKNEVLNLDELLAGEEARAEGWFQLMQTIRRIALQIIAFLAQIEDFQKRLWEKKKFVLSTEYCMTLDRVPEELYPEIARNAVQIEEWRRLFRIDEIAPNLFHSGGKAKAGRGRAKKLRLDVAFLKAYPTLVLDTRFFDQDFRDRLLATFENLEEQTGGLLIHSENFQALNLLLDTHGNGIKLIYSDPPYNTGADGFLYRDAYQHSSWLAMMDSRFALLRRMLRRDGVAFTSIDDNEAHMLRAVLEHHFGRQNLLTPVIWRKKRVRGRGATHIIPQTEYLVPATRDLVGLPEFTEPLTEEMLAEYDAEDKQGAYKLIPLAKSGTAQSPRPNLVYEIEAPDGTMIPCPTHQWRWSRETFAAQKAAGNVEFQKGRDGAWRVYSKQRLVLEDGEQREKRPISYYDRSSTTDGATAIKDLFGEPAYGFPKPYQMVRDIARWCTTGQDVVLDCFAGSGTTGHGVLALNAEDGGDRRYMLVEMAEYFDTVLKPRIQKIMFSREWKDGKPTSKQGRSHMFKYQRLESYEDALDNIAFDAAAGQKAFDRQWDDYLLRYMLDFETRDSETLLSVERLESPFSYTLRVHRDGETRERPVDLPETFNYLIGLHVRTRRVYKDGDRRYLVYRGSNERSEVVVIWRETKGWTQADLERDKQFVLEHKLIEGADEVFVNGDSFIPDAKALDPVFKRLMFAGAES